MRKNKKRIEKQIKKYSGKKSPKQIWHWAKKPLVCVLWKVLTAISTWALSTVRPTVCALGGGSAVQFKNFDLDTVGAPPLVFAGVQEGA